MTSQPITIVGSLPATIESVRAKYPEGTHTENTEFACEECKGKCFVSDGTYAEGLKLAKMAEVEIEILCENCGKKAMEKLEKDGHSPKGFRVHPQQMAEMMDVLNLLSKLKR